MESLNSYLESINTGFSNNSDLTVFHRTDVNRLDIINLINSNHSSYEEIRGGIIFLLFLDHHLPHANLYKLIQNTDFQKVRKALVNVLEQKADKNHIYAVLKLIRIGSMLDRKKLFLLLARLSDHHNKKVITFLQRYLRFGDQHSRVCAIMALKEMRAASLIDELIYILNRDRSEIVQLACLDAIETLKIKNTTSIVRFLLKNNRYISVRNKCHNILMT
jgi:HEAT repeat protein